MPLTNSPLHATRPVPHGCRCGWNESGSPIMPLLLLLLPPLLLELLELPLLMQ